MEVEPHSGPVSVGAARHGIGRYTSLENAVGDVLARWERMERGRMDIVAAIEQAEDDFHAWAIYRLG